MRPLEHEVTIHDQSIGEALYQEFFETFPAEHFEMLYDEGFPFYRTTFWYGKGAEATNVFERMIDQLTVHAAPSDEVTGVEWWFSVVSTKGSPQWLLAPHFDRSELEEKDPDKITHPEKASVLFLNSVPYGELVVTDQLLTRKGKRPRQPKEMRFIAPEPRRYAVFEGNLYHGVVGRMWRPEQPETLRLSMAVNYWTKRPEAAYLLESKACLGELELGE